MAKILLVEDDNNLREIYEARLQAEGYEIASAMDGEEALVVAKKENPDLVISDVMMPRISGFEMLDIMRNTDGLKNVKVIMLTALGQAEDKSRADSLGADRYLVKSQVTLEDIVKAAHELLGDPAANATPAPVLTPAAPTPAPVAQAAPAAVAAVASTPQPVAAPAAPVENPVMPAAVAPQPQPVTPAPAPTEPSVPVPAPAGPAPAPEPTPEVPAPAPAPVDAQPQPVAPSPVAPAPVPSNPADDVMAKALQDLGGGTSGPAPAPVQQSTIVSSSDMGANTPQTVAPTPQSDQSEDDAVTVAHKKVIRPISEPEAAKPGLDELMAREGVELDDHPHVNVGTQQTPMGNTNAPGAPHPPGHVIAPNGNQSVDPNSIAL